MPPPVVHRIALAFALALGLPGAPAPARAQVDTTLARSWFEQAALLCARDGGRLWGRSLRGPMVFADAATSTIATSEPPPDAPRPHGLGHLNAPVTWGGTRWSAYVWSLVAARDSVERGVLLIHELFHRVQPELGLEAGVAENDHLDTRDGRTWIRLEWRALSRALASSGRARRAALRDALAFRRARHAGFAVAERAEAADEIREGLAEYTGIVLATTSPAAAARLALRRLAGAEQEVSFVRRFHAASGPAYGVLLDAFAPGWTRRVTKDGDLARTLGAAARVAPATDLAAAAARHGGAEVAAAERRLDSERRARIDSLRARFVEGPVLIAPRPSRAAVNNLGATPIPDVGLVLQEYRATPAWGSLTATAGVLVRNGGSVLHLATPFQTSGATLSGEGWTITLAAGWTVRPGRRPGDFEIVRADD